MRRDPAIARVWCALAVGAILAGMIKLEASTQAATDQTFELYQGNTEQVQITIRDEHGDPIDLTTLQPPLFTWVAIGPGTTTAIIKTGEDFTQLDAANGLIAFDLHADDSSALRAGCYHQELRLSSTAPDELARTVMVGELRIRAASLIGTGAG